MASIEAELSGTRTPMLDECIERWITSHVEPNLSRPEKYRSHYNSIKSHTAGATIHDAVKVAALIRDEMVPEKLSANTIRQRLNIIKSTCTFAFKVWDIIDIDLCAKIKQPTPPKARERFATEAELIKLVNACEHDGVKNMIMLVALTGVRFAELSRMNENSICGNQIVIDGKNGKKRTFQISPMAAQIAESMVFPIQYSYSVYINAYNKACKSAGISDFKPHDLRHTFASWLAQSGVCSLHQLQQVMGHSKVDMTLKYAHLLPEHLDGVASSLGNGKLSELLH